MLLLRLYKDVILNENYNNVFSLGNDGSKTILDKYLETRDYFDVECPNCYYENNGEFIFDYEFIKNLRINNIYEYNYIRFIEMDETKTDTRLVRFCFVDDINIKNACVYLKYKEDIWSSYANKIKGITESLLVRSRINSYPELNNFIDLKNLPLEYDGNNKLEIIRFPQSQSDENKVQIILELQAYELVSAQDSNKKPRIISQFLYRDVINSGGYYVGGTYKFTKTEAQNKIIDLLSFQADYWAECAYWGDQAGIYKFEIGNIYMVPADYDIGKMATGTPPSIGRSFVRIKETNNIQVFDYKAFLQRLSSDVEGHIMKTLLVENNFKNLMIGTLNSPVKLENNGTDINVEIKMYCSLSDLAIYMNINNQMIDITDSFAFDFPFEPISATELSQRKIANSLKHLQIIQEQQNATYNFATSMNRNSESGIMSFSKGPWFGLAGMLYGTMRTIFQGLQTTNNVEKLMEQRMLINSPMYSNSKGVFKNSLNFINNIYGVVLFRINSDNDDYVKSMINNFGYKVYKFVNSELLNKMDINGYSWYNQNHINYNVVKFESSNVYGSFTREIANVLNEILENGVKIWYDYQMTEDNYVV